MSDCYKAIKTNEIIYKNKTVKKIEILSNLNAKNYKLHVEKNLICITCVCGSCRLNINESKFSKTIILNSPSLTVEISKNSDVEIIDCCKETKIGIIYYEEIINE